VLRGSSDRGSKPWRELADRLGRDLLSVTYFSTVPIQVEGRLPGNDAVYFRAKNDSCELYVTDGDQPDSFSDWDHWFWHGRVTEWTGDGAGQLTADEAESVLRRLVGMYLSGAPTDEE
jgi:hypothetical protein